MYKVGLLLEKISDKNLINKFLNFSIHDTNIINQLVEEYEINLDELDIYLNQNDIVYVEPNKTRINSSVVGPNLSLGLSALSLLVTIIALSIK